ncbi:hypothetical protein CJI52_05670, partial [Bifidobacteriaceae bacterium WP022]
VKNTISEQKVKTFILEENMSSANTSTHLEWLESVSILQQILVYPASESMDLYMKAQPTFTFNGSDHGPVYYGGDVSIHVKHPTSGSCTFIIVVFPSMN